MIIYHFSSLNHNLILLYENLFMMNQSKLFACTLQMGKARMAKKH